MYDYAGSTDLLATLNVLRMSFSNVMYDHFEKTFAEH